MIDIHCHILPYIDDGPKSFAESVAMARMAAADGTVAIVATPHINELYFYDQEEISRRAMWLRHLLKKAKIPISILTGADVNVVYEPSLVRDFTINNTDYILVEFPHTHLPANAKDILMQYLEHGYWPIITHPERNPSIVSKPALLLDLIEDNICVQLTAGSLTGEFGRDANKCAVHLLQEGVVDVIASDGHSCTVRKPELSKGVAAAAEIVGKKEARRMAFGNPVKIISGQSL